MRTAFDDIYDNYHKDLFQFVFYMVKDKQQTEDIVQEVYIKVLHSYETFKGESSEKTWLFSIARHVTIDFFRKQQRKRKRIMDFFDWGEKGHLIKGEDALPEEITLLNDEMARVYHCLDQCSIDQKSVIILRYIQSFSIEETASTLNWSISKVKTTQHRAMKTIKSLLNDMDREEGASGDSQQRRG
ncbi:RNA polymerase sigma factor SigX [Aquibacillus rhizosphaerae]|uniref:RNA polymerase sigma factor n=1 Tax=Aquibacillus rhizosphaerae TaxID=3051431 RepID=A0ABT7L4H6_9BACI|nr:RNA polymerase sigma factor SigX [Aquibacillus sp. LR5S19]MDL4840764.1 RNA polymerase sigma factor SigX [Aquibacillus sp. LR5S19]